MIKRSRPNQNFHRKTMTSDPRYTPTEHWYVPKTGERSTIGQKKIDELQRQILHMENDRKQRELLRQKLDRMQVVQDEKREMEEKVLERNSRNNTPKNSRNNTPRLLQSEMERLYGRDSQLDRNKSPGLDKNVIQTVIKHRTKEFSQKQQEAALKAKYLDKERQRLVEARRRVEEQRRALVNTMSPTEQRPIDPGPSGQPVQGVQSYIKQTVDALPQSMDKIWKMREDLQSHYNYYKKPYNGELGLSSYKPWQIQDYFMSREIVNDVVEDFLNLYFLHDDVVEKGTYKAMLQEEKVWMQRQSESIAEKRAVHLIAEDIQLDVTGDMTDEVIKEMYHMYGTFKNITDSMLMSEAEMISTGKDTERDPSERAYNMVTKAYFGVKENRNRHKDDVWSHSQYAQNKVKKRKITRKAGGDVVEEVEEIEDEEEEEDIDAPDLTIIDFNTISPVQLRSLEPSLIDTPETIHEKEAFQRFMRREIQYWGKITSSVQEITVYKQSRGIRRVVPSPNHRYIAVGTFHGDIMVYDVLMQPWRPIRVLAYNNKADEPPIDISWSIDSSRLIAINTLGYLQVLSIVGGPVDTTDAKTLALPVDDKGTHPFKLQRLLALDVDSQDFVFQQGTLADEGAQDDVGLAPEKAAFFPSISFMGTQNDIMVCLENGDILKCNIQNALKAANNDEEDSPTDAPRIYKPSLVIEDEAANINTIGKNVEAELLRGHKKSIMYIGFVQYLNALITVDDKGFINKWKYASKYKSSYGWFIPSRKYKLETSKIMYKVSGNDKPKVVFTDQTAEGKKPRTRQEIAAQRRRVQNTIDNMQLGDPWHEEYLEEDEINLQIFAPRGVIAETGAMFHLVYKHEETDQLSTYITRLYKPVKVRCSRIVSMAGSPTSTELIVMLLFGPYPPKGPHVTIFIVDLVKMELRDFRKDIDLSMPEFTLMSTKTIVSFDITRYFGPTGTEYMFIIFNGVLRCLSLTTGQPVVKVGQVKTHFAGNNKRKDDDDDDDEDEDDDDDDEEEEEKEAEFNGCIVDERLLQAPPDSECTVVCFEGKIHCVVFARKLGKMFIVTFHDKNVYADRRAIWKTYTTLPNQKLVPAELRVNTHNWKLDDIQHPAVNARKILLKKIDTEMRKAGLIRDHPKIIRRIALSDKVENYKSLDRAVTDSTLLEKEGIMQKRAASRVSLATPEPIDDDKF